MIPTGGAESLARPATMSKGALHYENCAFSFSSHDYFLVILLAYAGYSRRLTASKHREPFNLPSVCPLTRAQLHYTPWARLIG
jgi:hypothetical protein